MHHFPKLRISKIVLSSSPLPQPGLLLPFLSGAPLLLLLWAQQAQNPRWFFPASLPFTRHQGQRSSFSFSHQLLLPGVPTVGCTAQCLLRLSTLLLPSCGSLLLEPAVNSQGLGNWCLPLSVLSRPSLFSSTSVPYFLPCGPVLPFTHPAGCPPLLFSSPYPVCPSGPSQCHVFLDASLSIRASLCWPCACLLPFRLLSTSHN